MKQSIRKRVLSGILAGLMLASNVNFPASATEYHTTAQNTVEGQTADSEMEDFRETEGFADLETENIQETEGTQETEETQMYAQEQEPVAQEVVTGTFKVSGTIVFNENLDGTDWKDLVRPLEFDQPITIVQTYIDSNGEVQTVTSCAQHDISKENYYLKFAHDGDGGGDFIIENIPKSITDENGVEHQVTSCTVNVEPALPYYKSDTPISVDMKDPANLTSAVGTLMMSLKSQKLTLKPTVIPEGGTDKPSFNMKAVFTYPQLTGEGDQGRKLELTYKSNEKKPSEVSVPVGITYTLQQEAADGYRLNKEYTVTETTTNDAGETETKTSTSENSVSGTIAEKTDVTIITVNYAQNVEVGFDVSWVDNNKATRPTLSEDSFLLQYRTADGKWTELTEAECEKLNLEKMPAFDKSNASVNQYAYKGCPSVDAEGKALEYRVVVKTNPDNYVSDYKDHEDTGRREIIFEEQTSFQATITWNDIDGQGEEGHRYRPKNASDLKLRLYRRTEGGTYELVYDTLTEGTVTTGESGWQVKIPDLTRYHVDNKEYDYVLVQGSIGEDQTVTQGRLEYYKTYYSNGSGSFGNDTALCHNNGIITEVLTKEVEFHAKKIWKDQTGDVTNRPDAVVTLWRYVKKEAKDIDDAYTKGIATQVIFQTTGDGQTKDRIVSYQMDKTKGTAEDPLEITFTSETVSGMSQDYTLPLYDDQGQEYVYFVRESLSGEYAEDYTIQYTGQNNHNITQIYENGAPVNGIITNVRRKKEAVAITKIWKNPSGLAQIDGASVTVKITASADGGTTYDELTVYSDKPKSYDMLKNNEKEQAQTISGFTSSISRGDVVYYVNTYDKEGRPYDMEHAIIQETVTIGEKTYSVTQNESGDQIIDIDGSQYVVKSSYKNKVMLGDGIGEYRYEQTNTITARREYKVVKEWDKNLEEKEFADISQVLFKLERRSTKDKADGSLADYEVVKNGTGDTASEVWQIAKEKGRTWEKTIQDLPKYDAEGYVYYYRATEIGFISQNGKTITLEDTSKNRKWSVRYYRTPEQTKIVNWRLTEDGTSYIFVTKLWQDNGDEVKDGETRKNVQIRVYRKTQIKEALEKQKKTLNKNDTDTVDLNNLEGVKYYQTTLSNKGEYTNQISYSTLQENIDGNAWTDGKKDSWTNYIVVEHYVGDPNKDQATPAEYTYQQLIAAASGNNVILSGIAENKERSYRTQMQAENGQVFITNTRIGQTEISAKKVWNDENNAEGVRPKSIQFQLYRDGAAYTDIPDAVKVSSQKEDGSDSCNVTLNRSTGVITVSSIGKEENGKREWCFTIKGLAMFSATAVPHSYSLDEVQTDNADDVEEKTAGYSYVLKKTAPQVTETGKTQTYTFAFENTITGTTGHIAYKYWKDSGISSDSRPDLYMNLYRYLKKDLRELQKKNPEATVEDLPADQLTLYTEYKDQIWTPEPTEPAEGIELKTGYNWKITVSDLPEFDESGSEYGYVFKEKMNNDGKTVLGTYLPSTQTNSIASENDAAVYEDTYEVFTNVISDYMTIQGNKTWTGLAGYQTVEDELPDPLLTLYRTIDPGIIEVQTKSDDEIKKLISAGKLTLVDTTHLGSSKTDGNDKTRYTFPDNDNVTQEELDKGLISMQDGKAMLPKFDANGNRYTYLVRETIKDPIASQLYISTNINGTISNLFREDLNRRTITVTKHWAGRENLADNEKQYPSVTYTLYRYEKGKEAATTTKLETHTINADEFTGQNGQASYKFKDLLIYSPTGKQYCYYIEEKAISGYGISYQDEAGLDDKTLTKNQRMDVTSLPGNWDKPDAAINTDVATTNTYSDPGNVTISGEKKWDDYNNGEGLRPSVSDFKVTLTRHTNNEKGQQNKVDATKITLEVKDQKDESVKMPYIVWNTGKDNTSDTWTYTIYNLERYGANGMPYIYTLSEEQVTGYKKAPDITKTADTEKLQLGTMTNGFNGSYYVRKNWMDGNNKYNLRPNSITVKLQRSVDNGTSWEDIEWKTEYGSYDETTGKWTGLPSVMTNESGTSIVSVTLNASNVIRNTRNNSWGYTFTNLPVQNKEGKTYTYRCVETAIGGVPINEIIQEDQTVKYTAGAYECRYSTQNETKTVIENTLKSTSLVVTKTWAGDQDNKYQSRPKSLTFVLQKRGVKVENENGNENAKEENSDSEKTEEPQLSEWADVLKSDGTPYTFIITPNNKGEWKKTLEDLPTVEVYTGEDGTTYTIYSLYFRAVELHTDDSTSSFGKKQYGTTVSGAQNYKDTTDYSTSATNADHVYNKEKGRNESKITNVLVTDNPSKSIEVTKIWRCVDRAEKTAEFELLYKTKAENDESWHSYETRIVDTVSFTEPGISEKKVTWTDLPKYDRDGNELEYKVIEHSIDGYKTDVAKETEKKAATETTPGTDITKYTFTNIELQDYTVRKIWQNTDYSEKTDDGYTATFKLQQKIREEDGTDGDWKDVNGCDPITLISSKPNDTKEATWKKLPLYTTDGKEIIYRAVETKINGKSVDETSKSNGAYVVSYQYGKDAQSDPAFQTDLTVATNRVIYGFVNLSKKAAYLAPDVKEDKDLQNVTFNIYKKGLLGNGETLYVSNIRTDTNGNLIHENGKYGDEKKYLVAGTYVLKEVSTGSEYSVWSKGIEFTVGSGEKKLLTDDLKDTGEHGTAWISTEKTLLGGLKLKTEYKAAGNQTHTFQDTCQAATNDSTAVNLESRGVLTFIKTGPKTEEDYEDLNAYGEATGVSSAYFGVYLDEACTTQVAGLVPKASVVAGSTDKTTMVLTNKAKDNTTLDQVKDANDVPYLRAYESGTTYDSYPFTLLSGTYYIKELTAPAGYKLDTQVRKAVIAKIDQTVMEEDLTGIYPSNRAKISLQTENTDSAVADYEWSNEPNKVTLYKMDQYGRKVPLSDTGYLELKAVDSELTFPSGEKTIRLNQKENLEATKTDGTTQIEGVTYDTGTGAWTLTGLLDAGKTYTLSEPAGSVHANYIVAKEITFTMNADGTITVKENGSKPDTIQKENPLSAAGTDYQNYYKPDADENRIVMRDVARHLKNVALEKTDSETKKPIANISFKLYKYDGTDRDGKPMNVRPVLADGVYLTTDANGKIDLKVCDASITNRITGSALKNGLDVGSYYFEEVERGASDQYRLMENLYFAITPKSPESDTGSNEITNIDYEAYAKVTYKTTGRIDVTAGTDGTTAIVTNTPVTDIPKTLELVKVDSKDKEIKLAGGKFSLSYTSITQSQPGSAGTMSWNCMTDQEGQLYLLDDSGTEIKTDSAGNKVKPDISRKGTYTLKEIKAPDGYMTRTENSQPITLVTFKVDSDNKVKEVRYSDSGLALKQDPEISEGGTDNKEHIALNLKVQNEKTKLTIAKKNDIETRNGSQQKTGDQKSLNGEALSGATLEIYEGTDTTAADKKKATLGNNQSSWNWILPEGAAADGNASLPEGTLKENTIYTLHEAKAPIGYLKAENLYFKLSGTTTKDSTMVSQLYVWTGTGTPTSIDGNEWKETTNLQDNVLTMVDETIIAPVDLQKVVAGYDGTSWKAIKDVEFTVSEVVSVTGSSGNSTETIRQLGVAVTNEKGYLVWKSITDEGYASKLIYDAKGAIVTSGQPAIDSSIILKQNALGYVFTERTAPSDVYNDGRSYHVTITDQNYEEYRSKTASGVSYMKNKFINLVEAENAADHKVGTLSDRVETTSYNHYKAVDVSYTDIAEVEKKLAVNLPYKATVTLHKYDADEEGQKAAIPGTEFTLYKDSVSEANIYKKVNDTGIFTTDENGDISIEIHEKGTYILKETKAAAGYQRDANNSFPFVLADNASSTSYGYGTTTYLEKDENGVANKRLTGELTLTKTDAGTKEPLNEVAYTLKRTDVPKDAEGNDLSDYLLKDSVEVKTGHNYKTIKLADKSGKQTEESGQQISEKWTIQETGTNVEGKISITGLNWGIYVLTEKTELSGYKLEKDSDGNATNTHTYIIDGKTNQLSVSHEEINAKNSVVLNKTSITDAALELNNKPLAGAEFEIHEGNNCGGEHTGCTKVNFYTSATDKNSQTNKVTTDLDGNVVIYGLPTDTSSDTAKKTYHLVEVKAPKGYILQTTPTTFTIDRQGNVEIQKKSGNVKGIPVVSMQDEPIKIYVKKLGESGMDGLTGATFTLKDTCPKDESGKDTCETSHKLADGRESETLLVNSTDGILIPIERVIGGHTYTLTETKAPDGYEATAQVTFKVKTDGTIDEGSMTASGGYVPKTETIQATQESTSGCASLDTGKTTISIRDEKVRVTLTKVDDADQTTTLQDVIFTLTPYNKADGTKSSFTADFNLAGYSNITYDKAKDIYTLKTNDKGKIVFPDGLLKHDNSYLLSETASISGYYLSKEARTGVILDVDSAGKVSIRRLDEFNGTITKDGETVSSCPVTLKPEEGNTGSDLIAKNMKSTAFNLTKSVSGNMGDYNGSFAIKLEVYEPDGTKVGEKEITLKNGGKYSSKDGLAGLSEEDAKAFGTDAISVGSTLVITENNELNYTAVVKMKQQDGSEKEITHEAANKGQVKVTLDRVGTIEIELTNKKDVTIDVGVNTENQTPLAAVALLIPVLWLADRYRRKRRRGENWHGTV